MSLILNPCELCTRYTDTLRCYSQQVLEGDSNAISGLITGIGMMLSEPQKPEIKELLIRHPSACTAQKTNFCIYRGDDRQYLSKLKEQAQEMQELVEGVDKETKDAILRTGTLKFVHDYLMGDA